LISFMMDWGTLMIETAISFMIGLPLLAVKVGGGPASCDASSFAVRGRAVCRIVRFIQVMTVRGIMAHSLGEGQEFWISN